MKPIKMNEAWRAVMAMGVFDRRHKGVANTLKDDEIESIVATAEFFGASVRNLRQMVFDLRTARYRVFDWLAMMVMNRHDNDPGTMEAVRVFAYSFLKVGGDVDKFIEDLRNTDYQIDESYKNIEIKESEEE